MLDTRQFFTKIVEVAPEFQDCVDEHLADHEEAGARPLPLEDVEDRWRVLRMRAIVDGQQRWHALTRTTNTGLAVPVAGFVTDSVELQRDQFLRVNTVQPLPIGLVTELLPEVPTAPQ